MSELSKELICNYIEDTDYELYIYDVIDSTNAEARRMAESKTEENAVIIADCQTEGRGRKGRSFYSPKGSGLYMSFLLKANFPPEQSVLLTTAASVIVCQAIESVADIYPGIKWVNDLYSGGKKVCGILAEAIRNSDNNIEYVIIGIGINCDGEDFPDEIKDIAGSLGGVDRNRLATEVIKGMNNLCKMTENSNFIEEYKKRSLCIGKRINVLNQDEYEADAIDIDRMGGLVIRTDDGKIKTLSSGEISIRICGNNKE